MGAERLVFSQLATNRLILRRFADSDLLVLFAYRNDPEVGRYQSWAHPTKPG